jgi:hypothetical protein
MKVTEERGTEEGGTEERGTDEGGHRNPIWGNALAMKFFAGSVACVYELPCFQQQYHLVATSVSGS